MQASASFESKDRSERSADPNSSSPPSKREDPTALRLRRAWRSLASSLVVSTRGAEYAASSISADPSTTAAKKKAVQEAVATTLRARNEVRRVATLLEGKIRGNAKEIEALECCMRTQPCVGGRKRKRESLSSEDTTAVVNEGKMTV